MMLEKNTEFHIPLVLFDTLFRIQCCREDRADCHIGFDFCIIDRNFTAIVENSMF